MFAWLDELKAEASARGADLIDLGMGNPDQPTPAPIVEAIAAAYADPQNHGYPPFRGTEQFRHRRRGIHAPPLWRRPPTPASEVLCLSGAKEGLAHAIMAFADETTISLVPDIYYPVHGRASGLIGGQTHFLPLRAERGFLPDLGVNSRPTCSERRASSSSTIRTIPPARLLRWSCSRRRSRSAASTASC